MNFARTVPFHRGFRLAAALAASLFLVAFGSAETVRIRADSWMPMNGVPADLIRKLHDGEIDVFPETEAVFVWNVRELGFKPDDFRAEYTHSGDPIFVAFTAGPKGQRYAKLFDAGMERLRKSGELARILERYGVGRLL